ncbi:MAG: hypothetical protein RLZZ77_569 [Bacteroidota bacterium]
MPYQILWTWARKSVKKMVFCKKKITNKKAVPETGTAFKDKSRLYLSEPSGSLQSLCYC